MIDEILDLTSGSIFRFIKSIIKDILFDIVCYFVGWVFLRLMTLGKYPEIGLVDGIKEDQSEDTWVSITGLVLVLLGGYFLYG